MKEKRPELYGWVELPIDAFRKQIQEKDPTNSGYSAWQSGVTCVVSSLTVEGQKAEFHLSISRMNRTGRKNVPPRELDVRRALRAFRMTGATSNGVAGVCRLFTLEEPCTP